MRCMLTLLRNDLCQTIWCGKQHGEVQPPVANESDGNDDEDQMDDMVANISRGYKKPSDLCLLYV
jgi:hypothetical protein